MRIFLSAGEPSGDLHGANLIRELRAIDPSIEFIGFGGERMQSAGCRLLYSLCDLAVMWLARVLARAHVFLALVSLADRYFRHHPVDAVILIDYPGFNWWIARRAHFHKIPVFYFVPPQLWGWAGWRVQKMRRWVDHVLCTLPFEIKWYKDRGVSAHYVGHPFFDEVRRHQLNREFMEQLGKKGKQLIALLPGSRTQEIERNFASIVKAAEQIYQQRPDVRFAVACFKEDHRKIVQSRLVGKHLPIEVHVGKTPEIIAAASCCISVSGSVSLELLYRNKPTVIIYRISPLDMQICKALKTSRYITLVNLLADRELFPEFLVDHCPANEIANTILDWLNQPTRYEKCRLELADLCQQVCKPGACRHAAAFVYSKLEEKQVSRKHVNEAA